MSNSALQSNPNSALQNTNWLCLRLSIAAEYSELAAQALHEAGCQGVQIEDIDICDRGEDADLVPREQILVSGYYEQNSSDVKQNSDDGYDTQNLKKRLSQLLQEYSVPAEIEIQNLAAQDWAENWRENFPPLQIGPFLIAPSWEEIAPDDNRILIRLDPGLAFGTGQHPTTQMCLELLGEQGSALDGVSLLDVGCGSGVLSIAATKLGAHVTASDFDPHCTDATSENAAMNDVQFEVLQAAGLDWCQQQFDFIIANLMSDLLITLAPEIARVAKAKSTLIVSGISSPRADDVENALHQAGFTTVEKREKDGETRGEILERWTAFVMKNR